MIIREVWNWLAGNPAVGDDRSHRRFYSRRDLWEKRVYLWWLYPAIGLYTFGHSATNYPDYRYQTYEEEKEGIPKQEDNGMTAIKSTMAGVAWPLYWTWEVMDNDS